MTQVNYYQRGESLDYVNGTDALIKAGTLMPYGNRVAVAGCDMPPGALGSVHVVGVFKDVPKGAEAIPAGTDVYLQADGTVSASSEAVATLAEEGEGSTETAAPIRVGYTVGDAAEDDPTCVVKINA